MCSDYFEIESCNEICMDYQIRFEEGCKGFVKIVNDKDETILALPINDKFLADAELVNVRLILSKGEIPELINRMTFLNQLTN